MTIVINEADKLTKEAQAGLRRTMEKYAEKCRLILVCENLGKLIPALKSRCMLIRNSAPQVNEISESMNTVVTKENVDDNILDERRMEEISKSCDRNLRRALLRLQNCFVMSLGGEKKDVLPEWQTAIRKTVAGLLKEQTPKQLKS